jgi:hypothetical protein
MKFSTYLTEGLIKLPSKMFDEGNSYIVSQICSYVLAEVKKIENSTDFVTKFEDHVKEIAKKYNAVIKPSRKMSHTKMVLKKCYDDLPDKYKSAAKRYEKGLTLWIDWEKKGEFTDKNGYFRNTDEGIIGVSIAWVVRSDWKVLVSIIKSESELKERCDRFDDHIDKILGTFEHELTHFVQYKILPNREKQFTKNVTIASKLEAYLNSKVEFDPTLRSEVRSYVRQEKENLEIKMDKSKRSTWISYFVGALKHKLDPKKVTFDLPDDLIGYIKPSEFFLGLKKHSEKKWKLACKLFNQEVEKRSS